MVGDDGFSPYLQSGRTENSYVWPAGRTGRGTSRVSGFATAFFDVNDLQDIRPITLQLVPGSFFVVRVKDALGAPVVGHAIAIQALEGQSLDSTQRSSNTDRWGGVRSSLPLGRYRVTTRIDGVEQSRDLVISQGKSASIEFQMK